MNIPEIITIFISFFGRIPIIKSIWDRYAIKPHKVDLNYENIFFSRYINSENSNSGKIALVIYWLHILNNSKHNLTIKEINLHYNFRSKNIFTDSYVIPTGKLLDTTGKVISHAIIDKVGPDNIIMMDWCNIRSTIGKYKVLTPGEILSGSAVFVLEITNLEQLLEISKLKLVVKDFHGKKTEHPLQINDNWSIGLKKGGELESRPFKIKNGGKIEFDI